MSSAAPPRPGRPAGPNDNRSRIVAAAREEFAAHGFRATTLRAIASRAEVDVALLAHYFGNKDGLFAATLELPDASRGIALRALTAPDATQGELLTRGYLDLWEDPATSRQMQVLARSALSNEVATARILTVLDGATAEPEVAAAIEGRREGFTLAMAHLLGVAFGRYLTQVPALAGMDIDTLVARTAPAVQLHLDSRDGA